MVAVLFAHRLQPQAQSDDEVLRRAFGLSPAEAQLAVLLHNGLTLAEAAARSGKGIQTLRTQLRALFAKTGTRRMMLTMCRAVGEVMQVTQGCLAWVLDWMILVEIQIIKI